MPEGDTSLRLTYAQLAEARGISKASAQRLARANKWPRILGNDGVAIVIVPPGHDVPGSGRRSGVGSGVGSSLGKPGGQHHPRLPPPDHVHAPPPDIRGAIEAAIAPLQATIIDLQKRLDNSEEERRKLIDLLAQRPSRTSWWRWGRK